MSERCFVDGCHRKPVFTATWAEHDGEVDDLVHREKPICSPCCNAIERAASINPALWEALPYRGDADD